MSLRLVTICCLLLLMCLTGLVCKSRSVPFRTQLLRPQPGECRRYGDTATHPCKDGNQICVHLAEEIFHLCLIKGTVPKTDRSLKIYDADNYYRFRITDKDAGEHVDLRIRKSDGHVFDPLWRNWRPVGFVNVTGPDFADMFEEGIQMNVIFDAIGEPVRVQWAMGHLVPDDSSEWVLGAQYLTRSGWYYLVFKDSSLVKPL